MLLLLQRKKNKYYTFSVCVSSLRCYACNVHVSYCHLWPALLYSIFLHCLINRTIFETKLLNIKCVLILSTNFVCNVTRSKKNRARCD